MSELLELQHKLQDTSAVMAQLERSLAAHPDSPVIQLNLSSVVNRFRQLQAEFDVLADRKALDVCEYRLFKDEGTGPSLRGFSGALHEFQSAFSSLFDAIKNGRRMRTRLSADVVEATSFGFGYAYAGSVGVVLTLEKERLLLGGSFLDDTITTFFSLAKAPSHEDIKEIGKRLGPAPLRSIYKWAAAHAEDGIGADIVWREGTELKAKLFLQRAEMARLRDEIAATSEEVHDPTLTIVGTLTGASVETKRFDFRPDVGEPIAGRFTDAISESHAVKIPDGRYRAHLDRVTKVQYSSEQETVTWHLLKLDDLSTTR